MIINSLSDTLQNILRDHPGPELSVGAILAGIHERGFGLIILLFALPAALPLPALGVGTVLGAPLLLLTLQQAFGRKTIWVPQSLKYKTIPRTKFENFVYTALPYIEKIQILIRPRLGFITQGVFSHLIGVMGFIMALTVCLPFPLTNTVPSLGIAVMAIGVISRDGLAVLAGALIGLSWVLLLGVAVLLLGAEAIDIIKDFITSLF